MLNGENIVVLDLETAKSADDCRYCDSQSVHLSHVYTKIGWDDKATLGLSIGCWFDYTDGLFHWFDVRTLEATVRGFVDRHPLMVSFNGVAFDFPLMRGILRRESDTYDPETAPYVYAYPRELHALCDQFKLVCATGYDLLHEIWAADPARKRERGLNSLDVISQANGFGKKEIDGAHAPQLWRQGRHAEVLNYCQGDVLKTQRLFEQIVQTGVLLRGDHQPITLPRPMLPCRWPTEEKSA